MKRKIFLSLSLLLLATMAMAEGKQPAQADAPTQTAYTQSQQEDALLQSWLQGWFRGHSGKIQEIIKAKAGGRDAYLVFHYLLWTALEPSQSVSEIYLIEQPYEEYDGPATVCELIYHDLGSGKEFCGIKVIESITNKKTGKLYVVTRETKIDDASAQKIIDLLAGDSKWTNRTGIEFSETTSPRLLDFKIVAEMD